MYHVKLAFSLGNISWPTHAQLVTKTGRTPHCCTLCGFFLGVYLRVVENIGNKWI